MLEFLSDVFELCIIPLIGIVCGYAVRYLDIKAKEIIHKSDNELVDKYTAMITQTIKSCVIATNQTYVDALKKEGHFDLDAQKKALSLTKDAVMAILNDEIKDYINSITDDVELYITQLIEESVHNNK